MAQDPEREEVTRRRGVIMCSCFPERSDSAQPEFPFGRTQGLSLTYSTDSGAITIVPGTKKTSATASPRSASKAGMRPGRSGSSNVVCTHQSICSPHVAFTGFAETPPPGARRDIVGAHGLQHIPRADGVLFQNLCADAGCQSARRYWITTPPAARLVASAGPHTGLRPRNPGPLLAERI